MTKHREAYPTDLNDNEWKQIEPLLPNKPGGRPRKYPLIEILNAIFYIVRGGCAWRMMPHDLPPWKVVYNYFWTWRNDGLWEKINTALVEATRLNAGRKAQPSAAILDSQSVKTAEGGDERGADVHKQVYGRKRHIVVDTLGLLLIVIVHSAGLPDGRGGKLTLQQLFDRIKGVSYNRWCRLTTIWVDGAYEDIVFWVKLHFGWLLEVVRRAADTKGFVVLPKRWIVERTLSWLGRYRRLSKDYERRTQSSENVVYIASIHRMLKRLHA